MRFHEGFFPHYGSHSSSKDYCCLLPLISQNNNDCGVFPPITSHNRSVSDIFLDSHKPPTTHIKFTTIVYHLIYIWSKNSWFLKKILFWCNFHNSQRLQGDIVDMYKWHWWRYTLDNSWTSLYMDGTAIFDLPTWGGPFNPDNVTQIHSIFLKLKGNLYSCMPKVRSLVFFYIINGLDQNLSNSESNPILRM